MGITAVKTTLTRIVQAVNSDLSEDYPVSVYVLDNNDEVSLFTKVNDTAVGEVFEKNTTDVLVYLPASYQRTSELEGRIIERVQEGLAKKVDEYMEDFSIDVEDNIGGILGMVSTYAVGLSSFCLSWFASIQLMNSIYGVPNNVGSYVTMGALAVGSMVGAVKAAYEANKLVKRGFTKMKESKVEEAVKEKVENRHYNLVYHSDNSGDIISKFSNLFGVSDNNRMCVI